MPYRAAGRPMVVLILVLTVLVMRPVFPAGEPRVVLYGVPLSAPGQVKMIDGSTMVSLRAFAGSIGAALAWDEPSQTAILRSNSLEIRVQPNRRAVAVNSLSQPVSPAPCLVEHRIYVPLRSFGALCNERVYWDESTRTASMGPPASANGVEDEVLLAVYRNLYAALPRIYQSGSREAVGRQLADFYSGLIWEQTTREVWEYLQAGATEYGIFDFMEGRVVRKNPLNAEVDIAYTYYYPGGSLEYGHCLARLEYAGGEWKITYEDYQ